MSKFKMAPPEVQCKWFECVRKAHQKEIIEDYVELLADLLETQKEARVIDLSKRLGIAHVTASKMIQRLKKEGYVQNEPYRSIFLTQKGEKLAKKCKERHQIILDFLIRIGVPDHIAQCDAEGLEHHISEETMAILKNFQPHS